MGSSGGLWFLCTALPNTQQDISTLLIPFVVSEFCSRQENADIQTDIAATVCSPLGEQKNTNSAKK